MPSEWAYEIAREQRRDVETMATNLDAARAQGRRVGLEEALDIAGHQSGFAWQVYEAIRARIAQEPTA